MFCCYAVLQCFEVLTCFPCSQVKCERLSPEEEKAQAKAKVTKELMDLEAEYLSRAADEDLTRKEMTKRYRGERKFTNHYRITWTSYGF